MGSNGLEIGITGISQDGEDIISGLISDSEPANDGFRYYLVNISISNPSDNSPITTNLTHFKLIGNSRYVYDTTNSPCGYNPEITDREIYGDGQLTGHVCFQVPVLESNLVLIHDPDSDTEKRRYLSLDYPEGTEPSIPDPGFAWGRTYRGDILQLSLEQVIVLEEVAYTEEPDAEGLEKVHVIRSSDEENELVLIRAKVGNHAATLVQLDIEALPPELRTSSGRHHSVNTYKAGMPTDRPYVERDAYIPFIRGSQRVEKGFELDGWLIFDVPKGSDIVSFKWRAGEEIVIDVEYEER